MVQPGTRTHKEDRQDLVRKEKENTVEDRKRDWRVFVH
jgi:hypothetical protein